MKLGMQNDPITPNRLLKDVTFAERNNFEYFEIVTESLFYSPTNFSKSLIEKLKKFDINYNIHASNTIFIHLAAMDEYIKEATEKLIEDNIELGRKLDVGLINLHYYSGYFFPKVNKEFRDFIDSNRDKMLDKFVEESRKYGIKFTIENTRGETLQEIQRVLNKHRNLMLTFDIQHAYTGNDITNILNFIERFSRRIINVHLVDGKKNSGEHMVLGEGDVPVIRILKCLRKLYDGPYILEMQTRKDILKSLKFLKERKFLHF